jgi:hypothetical protein
MGINNPAKRPEVRAILSKPRQPHSEETKAKLRAANIGKKRNPVSEETRAKLRAKTLEYYANKKALALH